MTAHSTLFTRASAPTVLLDDGNGKQVPVPDVRYVVVSDPLADGSVVIHGQPGSAVPVDAIHVYYDGSVAWTWAAFAVGPSALTLRPHVTPHEWFGEPTAAGVTAAQWPKLTPIAPQGG